MFAEFVIDKIKEYFPEIDNNRATELPNEYYDEKFHILPDSIKKFFLYCADKANEVSTKIDEDIQSDFKHTKGLPHIDSEEAECEKLRSDAVNADSDMSLIAAKCEELMRHDVLPDVKPKDQQPK